MSKLVARLKKEAVGRKHPQKARAAECIGNAKTFWAEQKDASVSELRTHLHSHGFKVSWSTSRLILVHDLKKKARKKQKVHRVTPTQIGKRKQWAEDCLKWMVHHDRRARCKAKAREFNPFRCLFTDEKIFCLSSSGQSSQNCRVWISAPDDADAEFEDTDLLVHSQEKRFEGPRVMVASGVTTLGLLPPIFVSIKERLNSNRSD